jgi:putative transposase
VAVAGGGHGAEQGPARGDFVGRNPTDRGKPGTKRGLLTEEQGGPLGAIVAPANQHDSTLIEGIIEAAVVDRPAGTEEHLCLDKGFDTPAAEQAVGDAGYRPHIRRIGEEKKPCDRSKGHKPRRWVVERTIGWLNRCRAILVRYDKKAENYLGLTQLACALLWWRRLCKLCGEPVLG